jgi:hypothetical protein
MLVIILLSFGLKSSTAVRANASVAAQVFLPTEFPKLRAPCENGAQRARICGGNRASNSYGASARRKRTRRVGREMKCPFPYAVMPFIQCEVSLFILML